MCRVRDGAVRSASHPPQLEKVGDVLMAARVARMVCIPVDDLLRMLGDYLGESNVPFDSKPHRVVQHPISRQMGLEINAPSLPEGGAMFVDFQIKRYSPVSGPASEKVVSN